MILNFSSLILLKSDRQTFKYTVSRLFLLLVLVQDNKEHELRLEICHTLIDGQAMHSVQTLDGSGLCSSKKRQSLENTAHTSGRL